MSTYFASINRSKRSLALDLKSERGREVAQRLAEKADVVVENYKVGGLAPYGLCYRSVSARNPSVVYCSITGYGQTGPDAQRAGYDVGICAESGLMSVTGEADGPPVKPGVAVTDLMTGLHAVSGVLAGLLEVQRQRLEGAESPVGRHIDVSMLDCQLGSLANIGSAVLNHSRTASLPEQGAESLASKRWGSAHGSIVPYQCFEASDGQPMVVCAMSDSQFAALCGCLGGPLTGMAEDPLYATNARRVEHREAVIHAVQLALLQSPMRTRDAQLCALHAAGLSASPVNSVSQAYATPQARARGATVRLQHASIGEMDVPGPAVKAGLPGLPSSESGPDPGFNAARAPPPLLGEHSREVLSDWLGDDADELVESGLRQGWLQEASLTRA